MRMITFLCDHCGKCCTSLGHISGSSEQLSEQDYYCKNGITGNIFPVHVAPEFAGEIDEDFTSGTAGSRQGCIFLRRNPAGPGFVCAIYPTGPGSAGSSGVTTW